MPIISATSPGRRNLRQAYDILDASAVQPLAYLSVVYASVMGPVIFHEEVHLTTYAGAAIVIAGGLLSIWSERRRRD
jgi:drug/metabolite transporter (DMT)-like permease